MTSKQRSRVENTIKRLGLSEEEALTALKSSSKSSKPKTAKRIRLSQKSFTFGYFSDTHIGHKKFNEELFAYMVKFFKSVKLDFIVTPGDHLEGMSGRPGHIYELSEIGFQKQFEKCLALYKKLPQIPIYGIDGNHDAWYFKKNNGGIVVGQELENCLDNYTNLGQDEGDLVVDGVKIKLFHANDGTAYATSYKLQKLIESFSGGEKPNVLLSGHYHKALYMFCRGVHGLECGTICGQTGWMRGKKIPAHQGFGVITITTNKKGVERLQHEFVPSYKE